MSNNSNNLSKRKTSRYRSIHKKNNRYKRNEFLIEGKKNTFVAIQENYPLEHIYYSKKAKGKYLSEISKLAKDKNIKLTEISQNDIENISTLVNPEGIISIGKIPADIEKIGGKPRQLLYLYEIRDPGNLGTIMRTAAWFNINHIILSPRSVDPFNPKVVRGSMGGLFYINITRNYDFESIKQLSKENKLTLISTDDSGTDYTTNSLPDDFVLCMGNESHGLPENILDQSDFNYSIPRAGKGDSLNLAISAGILMKDLTI